MAERSRVVEMTLKYAITGREERGERMSESQVMNVKMLVVKGSTHITTDCSHLNLQSDTFYQRLPTGKINQTRTCSVKGK